METTCCCLSSPEISVTCRISVCGTEKRTYIQTYFNPVRTTEHTHINKLPLTLLVSPHWADPNTDRPDRNTSIISCDLIHPKNNVLAACPLPFLLPVICWCGAQQRPIWTQIMWVKEGLNSSEGHFRRLTEVLLILFNVSKFSSLRSEHEREYL